MSQPGGSLHIRFSDQSAVAQAIRRVNTRLGEPATVWPARKLPLGLFVGPPRAGWVSVWSTLPDLVELVGPLTATLECGALSVVVIPEEFWTLDAYRHGVWLGGWVRPPVQEVEFSDEAGERELLQLGEEPPVSILEPLLPAGVDLAGVGAALFPPESEPEEMPAGESLAALAAELSLWDLDWDPCDDLSVLSEGDYDADDMPSGWERFVLLPTPELPFLGDDWDEEG